MANLKEKIKTRRQKIDEASGFGSSDKSESTKSYEEEFDDVAKGIDKGRIKDEIKAIEAEIKRAKTDDAKMELYKKKNKLQVRLKQLK